LSKITDARNIWKKSSEGIPDTDSAPLVASNEYIKKERLSEIFLSPKLPDRMVEG
jgi:hypothetical protein